MKFISRNVVVLSTISLFTDIASEMLYPVMPIYLKTVGFSVVLIGVLEGFAEATAGLSKGYFGNMSDNIGKRLPFVQIGYALSTISKPMMAIFTFPFWIFSARSLDRLGKGIRTGARDALLSDEATPETKGRVFGFHRAMDTSGAFLGPLIALVYLAFYPHDYKILFYAAFFPGIAAIAITFLIKEKKKSYLKEKKETKLLDFVKYWKSSPDAYRKLVGALLFFTLFNSSDVFLLLKIKEAGYNDTIVIGIYVFYNLIYAAFSYPLGILADKIGMKIILTIGLLLFSATYFGMTLSQNMVVFVVMFFFYGLYSASTEGIAKAWITNICKKENTATAIGTYTAFQSIATLIASSLAGVLWYQFGSSATFALTAISSFVMALYISQLKQ